jgi:hypothetical protein
MKRRLRHATRILALGLLASAIFQGGCTEQLSPPVRSDEPIGVQLMRAEPMFVGTPFRVLLDFESPADLSFLSDLSTARIDTAVAHTGASSLQLPAGSAVTVKLPSLLSSSAFPAAWTLAGGYFISRESASIAVTYEVGGTALLHRTVNIEPRKWTAVMLDIAMLNDPNIIASRDVGVLRFKADRTVWCDDVLLVDNAHTLVGETDKAGDNWTVRQRGFATLVERPGSFKLSIPTPEAAADGWQAIEANEMRVVLTGGGGKRIWAIYSDGRGYLNSRFEPIESLPADRLAAYREQHASPAEISVPEEQGRIERNAPGDRNNDGYAEATGTYQIKATSPRLRITITPQTPKLLHPVLEIAGFPAGRVTGNMEGQLLDKAVRLPNGHVLIEVPATLSKVTTLDIRVQ